MGAAGVERGQHHAVLQEVVRGVVGHAAVRDFRPPPARGTANPLDAAALERAGFVAGAARAAGT